MERESLAPGACYFYYPRLVCVVGVRDEARGTVNFAPVAWASPLSSDPPLFGVCLSPATHSHHLVLRTGEFTVNFLDRTQAELTQSLGRLSGRDVDKVAALGLVLEPPESLETPSLAAAYVSAECLLRERHHLGDQTLFVGEVQVVHARTGAFDHEGVLRTDVVSPLLYLGSSRYITIDATTITRSPVEVPA
jgi:flavin reductase (DIM6/NTAB) family NADH-FMN oxidoreductase RutF